MTVSTCRDDDDDDDDVDDDDDDDDDDHDDDDDDDNCHKYDYEVVLCFSFEKGSTSEAKWQHQMRVAMGAKRNFVLLGETDDPQLKWYSKQKVVSTAPMDGSIKVVPLLTYFLRVVPSTLTLVYLFGFGGLLLFFVVVVVVLVIVEL